MAQEDEQQQQPADTSVKPSQKPGGALSSHSFTGGDGRLIWRAIVPAPPPPYNELDWPGFEDAGKSELLPLDQDDHFLAVFP